MVLEAALRFDVASSAWCEALEVDLGSVKVSGYCQRNICLENTGAHDKVIQATSGHDDLQLLDESSRTFMRRTVRAGDSCALLLVWNPQDSSPLAHSVTITSDRPHERLTLRCSGLVVDAARDGDYVTMSGRVLPSLQHMQVTPVALAPPEDATSPRDADVSDRPLLTFPNTTNEAFASAHSGTSALDSSLRLRSSYDSASSSALSSHRAAASARIQRVKPSLRTSLAPAGAPAGGTPLHRYPPPPRPLFGGAHATPEATGGWPGASGSLGGVPGSPRSGGMWSAPLSLHAGAFNFVDRRGSLTASYSNEPFIHPSPRVPRSTVAASPKPSPAKRAQQAAMSVSPRRTPFKAPRDWSVDRLRARRSPTPTRRSTSAAPSRALEDVPGRSPFRRLSSAAPKPAWDDSFSKSAAKQSPGQPVRHTPVKTGRKAAPAAPAAPPPDDSSPSERFSHFNNAIFEASLSSHGRTSPLPALRDPPPARSRPPAPSSGPAPAPSARAAAPRPGRPAAAAARSLRASADGPLTGRLGGGPRQPSAPLHSVNSTPTKPRSSLAAPPTVRDSWSSSLRATATATHMRQQQAAAPLAIYQTESWQRKQELAFTGWVNAVLSESFCEVARLHAETYKAFTSRQTVLAARRTLGRLRSTDADVVHALERVEAQLRTKQLGFLENSLLNDAAMLKKAVRTLMSYHPFWLQLGVDTVLNRRTFRDTGDEGADYVVNPRDLEAMLREEFLSDEALLGGASVLTRQDKREALSALVLYRVLQLVLLLDRVPRCVRIPHDAPFLFRLTGSVKSSERVIMDCLLGSLRGMGDPLRHLRKLHYVVSYEQRDVDEYPMVIDHLSSGLANGIILCKLVSLLFQQDLMGQVRTPTAEQRAVKLRNVKTALAALHTGTPLDLTRLSCGRGEANEFVAVRVEDVVSGHCKEVLALMWAICLHSLPTTVPMRQLATEIALLEGRLGDRAPALEQALQPGNDSEETRALLRWTQCVCGVYGVTVRNFTTSFSDGSALCLLVHHYVPSLVNWSSIAIPPPVPPDVAEEILGPGALRGREALSWADYVGMQNSVVQEEVHAFRAGIVRNFQMLHDACDWLGNVPAMLSPDDILNRSCDERAVVVFASLLCPRLLNFAYEGKAAQVIADWWRWKRIYLMALTPGALCERISQHVASARASANWLRLCRRVRLLPFQEHAAAVAVAAAKSAVARARWGELAAAAALVVALQRRVRARQARAPAERRRREYRAARCIQAHVRGARDRRAFLRLRAAAVVVQAQVRGRLARRRLAREAAAAVTIQAAWRAWAQRLAYLVAWHQVVLLQCHTRGFLARFRLWRRARVVATIQRAWRSRALRRRFLSTRAAAVTVQAAWRGARTRRRLSALAACVVRLQALARGRRARRAFAERRAAASTIAAGWRGVLLRREMAAQRRAAVVVQSAFRGHAVRSALRVRVASATRLQCAWRAYAARRGYAAQLAAAVVIQAHVRCWLLRREYLRRRGGVILLQAHVRRCAAQRRFRQARAAATAIACAWRRRSAMEHLRRCRASAICIQTQWRAHTARRSFTAAVRAVVVLQAAARGLLARRSLQRQQAAATVLQAGVRRALAMRRLATARAAAVVVQTSWRRHSARRRFERTRRAVVVLQAHARGHLARRELAERHAAATAIQAAVRRRIARRRFCEARVAAVTIQRHARGLRCRRSFRATVRAVVVLQAVVRGAAARALARSLRRAAAATKLQAAWRAYAARRQYAATRARVVALQAAARGALARRRFLRCRAAAVRLQAAARCFLAVRRLQRLRAAALTAQRFARGALARRRFAATVRAVVVVQSHARGMAARSTARALRRDRAATVLQSAWRGRVVRAELARRAAAAAVVKAALLRHWRRRVLARRRVAVWRLEVAIQDWLARKYRAEYEKFKETLRVYALQRKAATKITAAARGFLVRLAMRPALDALKQRRLEARAATTIAAHWRGAQARRAAQQRRAAFAVLAAWLPVLRARCALRAAQRTARRRAAAATVIQRAVRVLLRKRALERAELSITRLQALWRGRRVRAKSSRKVKEAAARLRSQPQALGAEAQKALGPRTKAALATMLCSQSVEQAMSAAAAMAWGTTYSRHACQWVAQGEGLAALLKFLRVCNRSKPHQEMLAAIMTILTNLLRQPESALAIDPDVLAGFVPLLSDNLQFFRDNEEIFVQTVSVLRGVCARSGVLERLPASPVAQWDGVCRVLATRMKTEGQYIAKLEVKKGSDASAGVATRRLIATAMQLRELQELLAHVHERLQALGARAEGDGAPGPTAATGTLCSPGAWVADLTDNTSTWKPKNTIVRSVFSEVLHCSSGLALPVRHKASAQPPAAGPPPPAALAATPGRSPLRSYPSRHGGLRRAVSANSSPVRAPFPPPPLAVDGLRDHFTPLSPMLESPAAPTHAPAAASRIPGAPAAAAHGDSPGSVLAASRAASGRIPAPTPRSSDAGSAAEDVENACAETLGGTAAGSKLSPPNAAARLAHAALDLAGRAPLRPSRVAPPE